MTDTTGIEPGVEELIRQAQNGDRNAFEDRPWLFLGFEAFGFLVPVDLDGDGFLDLTTQSSCFGDFAIRTYHGAGDGTFPRESGPRWRVGPRFRGL